MKKVDSRILIVDDNQAIHEDFRNLLMPRSARKADQALASLERELFGETQDAEVPTNRLSYTYHLDSAAQGQEALTLVSQACEAGNPYWLVFMDVRMPPGMDGIQTTKKLWGISPETQVVICSAYSDYSWDSILSELGERDNLFFIRKPFDPVAIKQSALTFSKKWELFQRNKKYTEQLRQEVSERTAELEKTVAELKTQKEISDRSSKAKSVFLSNMSHEIRTPLHGIIGMADVLAAQNLDADKREQVKTISTSSKMLLNIINEILDYSKIEAGKLELDEAEIDLRCLVECVGDLLAPTAHEKDIELLAAVDSATPRRVLGDPLRVRQVLLNLVNNAIKFTPAGGCVHVAVRTETQPDGRIRCRFTVRDQGIGMEKDQLALIFTPYVQTEKSISRRYGGTGLGLSICKKLVEVMQGEIYATSQPGQGSTFEFYFDATRVGGENLRLTSVDPALVGRQLFVIGDNEQHFEILTQYAADWQLPCQHVSPEAIDNLRIAPDDLVLVDLFQANADAYIRLIEALRDRLPSNHAVGALIRYGNRCEIGQLKEHNYTVTLYRPVKYRALYAGLKALTAGVQPQSQVKVLGTGTVSPRTSRAGLRVLVVEDNVVNQQVIAGILKPMEIAVSIAENGRVALDMLHAQAPFDLIFMDVNMPVMDGVSATKAIRSDQRFDTVPIIALSADAFHANREECLAVGMNDFVSKPFTAKVIVAAIDKFIQIEGGVSSDV